MFKASTLKISKQLKQCLVVQAILGTLEPVSAQREGNEVNFALSMRTETKESEEFKLDAYFKIAEDSQRIFYIPIGLSAFFEVSLFTRFLLYAYLLSSLYAHLFSTCLFSTFLSSLKKNKYWERLEVHSPLLTLIRSNPSIRTCFDVIQLIRRTPFASAVKRHGCFLTLQWSVDPMGEMTSMPDFSEVCSSGF